MLTATDKIAIYKKGIDNQFVDPEFQEMMKAEIAKLEGGGKPEFGIGDFVTYMAGDDPEFKMYGVITRYDGIDSFGHHMYRVDAYGYEDPSRKDKGPMIHDDAKHNQKFGPQLKKSDSGKYHETAKADYEAFQISRKGGSKQVEPIAEPTKEPTQKWNKGDKVVFNINLLGVSKGSEGEVVNVSPSSIEVFLGTNQSGKKLYKKIQKFDYYAIDLKQEQPLAEPTKDDYISALEGAELLYEVQPTEDLLSYIEAMKLMIEAL